MKDERFLPVDKHEPIEEYDDYVEEREDDDLDIAGDAGDSGNYPRKAGRETLYMAS